MLEQLGFGLRFTKFLVSFVPFAAQLVVVDICQLGSPRKPARLLGSAKETDCSAI